MANETNIPGQINIPGSLTGRHEESFTSPMSFSSFSTNMKSDIAPMGFAAFTTRMKSDVFPIPFANFTTAMKSDIAPMSTLAFSTNMKSDVAPIAVSQFNANLKSDISPLASTLGANNQASNTAPLTSTLGANNQTSNTAPLTSTLGSNNVSSNTAPLTSTLGANNQASNTAPINSELGGRHESSNTAPLNSVLGANNESSNTAPINSELGGRHESSGVDDGATTLGGRHESSGVDDGITTLSGRHESSGIDDSLTSTSGRHESSDIDTTAGVNFLDDTFAQGFTPNQPLDGDFTPAGLEFSPYPGAPAPSLFDGRHESSGIDTTAGVDFLGFNTDATGFTVNNSLLASQYQGISGDLYTYPDSQGLGFGILSTPIALAGRNESSNFSKEPGVNFVDIPNTNATGFTIQNSLLDSQFKGISGQSYTYPDAQGLGFGSVDSSQGVNFVDIPNLDSQGFTTFFDTGIPTQFKGATAGEYTYPDSHGLGYGLIGNSLFTNMYPTPYTTPLFPDGFVQNQSVEDSQFSKDSFAGGGKIGLETEFTHATFGGVQAQVPIMGNNPTGLGSFTSGGETSGDIGIINAFDDTTSGAKGFTPQMFDLGLPKTQFNGVAGTPGSLEYTYPTDVGPAGVGRLMYDVPFSDAGNPYGGSYISSLANQIPNNPSITINKLAGTDPVDYSFYNANPDRLHFNEGNRYETSLGNFEADIELNGSHPKSVLANFAAREHSPSPLDNMQVLIPGNTGPVGAETDTAKYTSMDGYPNYNTQNLSYSTAGVLNQREGFERNELISRWEDFDYNKSELYGHDITFGGYGDDPKGLKSYKKPHIIRDIGKKWNGFSNEGTPFDEGAFRGGFLTLGNRALLDVVRNTKHIISDPIKGLLWGLKQIGLQASNPKVETEMAFLGRRTRVFNLGIGLLANMLTGPFGIKLYRHGLLNGIGEGDSTYEKAVKAHGGISPYDSDRVTAGGGVGKGGGNRLAQLKDELLFGGGDAGPGGFLGLGNLLGYEGQKIDMLSDNILGGPKSLYGLGGTTIRRYDNSTQHNNGSPYIDENRTDGSGGQSDLLAKYLTLGHAGIEEMQSATNGNPYKAHDFRKALVKSDDDNLSVTGGEQTFPYDKFSREALFGYTRYDHTRDRTVLPKAGESQGFNLEHGVDNFVDFDQDYTDDVDKIGENKTRDMIKLIMEDIPGNKIVRMRSYLTEISDTITPEWSKTSYIGRPDQVHNYTGASRQVTFTLKFAALSRNNMIPMYQKVNYLYGLCYPHLTKGSPNEAVPETMISPIIKLTMGDWLYKCPGYFDSMATTIDNDYPWEINLEEDPYQVAQLPTVISVALGFTVIGDGPHYSAIQTVGTDKISGIHIGGGVNGATADGKFFGELPITTD